MIHDTMHVRQVGTIFRIGRDDYGGIDFLSFTAVEFYSIDRRSSYCLTRSKLLLLNFASHTQENRRGNSNIASSIISSLRIAARENNHFDFTSDTYISENSIFSIWRIEATRGFIEFNLRYCTSIIT